MKLQGKVAAITGAGSGMGRATALLFAQAGAAVVVADIDGQGAAETVALVQAAGGRAVAVTADVTRKEANVAIADTAVREFGRLDIFYANAGIGMPFTPIEETDGALIDRLLGINVKGVILGVQAALPALKGGGGGVVLITASTAGHRPRPGLTVYNATKGALITLTKSLALELAPHRIRVNCISPVATDTPMLAKEFMHGMDPAVARQKFISTIPWGRLNAPEDIARAALFLASADADMITGISLEVDGGRDV